MQRETSALYKKSGVNPTAGEGLGFPSSLTPFPVSCRTVSCTKDNVQRETSALYKSPASTPLQVRD